MLMGGENVGKVCAVQDVLERWEDTDPDVRAILDRNKTEMLAALQG